MPQKPIGTPLETWIEYKADPTKRLRDTIAAQNHGLVLKAASRMQKICTESKEDLEQIGVIGLLRAIGSYDYTTGYKFSSHAMPWINGEILHHLRDNRSLVKVPRNWQETFTKVRKGARILQSDLEGMGRIETLEWCMVAEAKRLNVKNWPEITAATRYLPTKDIDELSEVIPDRVQASQQCIPLLAKLPASQREAIVSHVINGDRTPQHCESLVTQGLERLKTLLGETNEYYSDRHCHG